MTGAGPSTPAPGRPRLSLLLWRGARRRCPRCGSGGAFVTWFRLAERCPGCRLRFEREGDFFLGAYVVNLAVTEGLLAIALFAYILRAVDEPGTSLLPVLVAVVVLSVVAPVLFFPFARTIWAAVDLATRPVAPDETGPADGRGHGDGSAPPVPKLGGRGGPP